MKDFKKGDIITLNNIYIKNLREDPFRNNLETIIIRNLIMPLKDGEYLITKVTENNFNTKIYELNGLNQSYLGRFFEEYYRLEPENDLEPNRLVNVGKRIIKKEFDNKQDLLEDFKTPDEVYTSIFKKSSNFLFNLLPKTKFEICKIKYRDKFEGFKHDAGFVINDNKGLILNNNKLKTIEIIGLNTDYLYCIQNLAQAKIKDYTKSGELFGYKLKKKLMFDSNQLFKITNIQKDYIAKKDNNQYDIIELNNENVNLKFLLSDIELVFPKLDGYNIPKDRTITFSKKEKYVNKEVRIINNKKLSIDKNTKGKVLCLWNDHIPVKGGSMNKKIVNYDRNTKCKVLINNKEITCKIKNIKLIE